MSTSVIPAAIDGLLSILASATGLSGVQVVDGQPTTNTAKDVVCVGYTDEGQAVSFEQAPKALGNLRRDESFEITCMVSAWNGNTIAKTVRDRAFDLFAACETAIRDGATLNGSVIFAEVRSGSVSQYQTDQGAVCDVQFTVAGYARI